MHGHVTTRRPSTCSLIAKTSTSRRFRAEPMARSPSTAAWNSSRRCRMIPVISTSRLTAAATFTSGMVPAERDANCATRNWSTKSASTQPCKTDQRPRPLKMTDGSCKHACPSPSCGNSLDNLYAPSPGPDGTPTSTGAEDAPIPSTHAGLTSKLPPPTSIDRRFSGASFSAIKRIRIRLRLLRLSAPRAEILPLLLLMLVFTC